jgi:hypothetical protein
MTAARSSKRPRLAVGTPIATTIFSNSAAFPSPRWPNQRIERAGERAVRAVAEVVIIAGV